MLYHIALTCQNGACAQALFADLSTCYREVYPAMTPFAYGETLHGHGFVVVQWHGELDESVLEHLYTDSRIVDFCSYAVPFFSPETPEHGADDELARLSGLARAWKREDGQ